ncbi:dihydroxyacetone kinase, C-terminal domain [Geodermatophilus telluris]|uniref:Dihydroxyacetone kinase, C-terminal domain n=1 Tax=Geodermatophilus telluris TaxID=1190417 RepID=A0A1G6QNN7_9ACTN|nr:dihydroxyacetone kinase subunit DhaL [Geodermatophilus telluris]SDC93831.1 dihydroxyacetone kinase, C-terminal domain [Geodermatophilus telluris]
MEQVSADDLLAWIREFARLVAENRDALTELDAAIGDGDHGANMHRGTTAVLAAVDGAAPAAPGALVKKVGTTLVSTVGGASGPLYGTFFLRLGTALGDAATASPADVAAALRAGVEGVVARGRAEAGDKTMVDALLPAVTACEEALAAGRTWAEALAAAAEAAAAGRDATTPMVARKGRASYLGERSAGHPDPGATSAALLLAAAAGTLAGGSR